MDTVKDKMIIIKNKLTNGDFNNLTSEELSIIVSNDLLSELLINTFLIHNSLDYNNELLLDCLNTIAAKKIAIVPETLTDEEKEEKIKIIKERIELLSSKYKENIVFHLNEKSYIDIMNLDEEIFNKVINIIDNINPYDLNDFNGTVISLDQLNFPREEDNKHVVRLFNEIVDAHKRSLTSNNKKENVDLYNNLLFFLEISIDDSILNIINKDKELLSDLKKKGYISNDVQRVNAQELINIIKIDIDNTRDSTRYDFLHKVVRLYVEKERTNYVNNNIFNSYFIYKTCESKLFEQIKRNNYRKAIQELIVANSYVDTDDDEAYDIALGEASDQDKVRLLYALYKKNYQKLRISKDIDCRREREYNLPYNYNKSSLRSILQNDILSNLEDYSIEIDGRKYSLKAFLINEIVNSDSIDNALGEDKIKMAEHLLDLYIERIKGLQYEEKKHFAKCLKVIDSLIDDKEQTLFVDNIKYDINSHNLSDEMAITIKNAEKKKKNNLENIEKKINNILINDIINNYQNYSIRVNDSDLRLDEYLVNIVNNIYNESISSEDIRKLVLRNLENYGKEDVKLEIIDKKINKLIKEEVARLKNSKDTLYVTKNVDGRIVNENYDSETHKKELELDKELEKVKEESEIEFQKTVREAKILDIFNNMSRFDIRIDEASESLYDYLLEVVGNYEGIEDFSKELDKIIRIKKDIENKKILKVINTTFKDLLPLEEEEMFKQGLRYYDEPYSFKEHIRIIRDSDIYILDRSKEYHMNNVKANYSIFDVIYYLDIEELKKNLLEDEEAYNSFIKLLKDKKFLSIPELLETQLERYSYYDTPESMAMFIDHYKEIIDREKKAARNKGSIFSESSLSIPRIIELGNVQTQLHSKYSALFGSEDTLYLYKDPGTYRSTVIDKELRFALGVYYLLSNYNRQYVTVPPFDEDIEIEDGYDKKINVSCGNFSDTVNLTHGERTDACMRIGGIGRTLFDFCLTNENGFHIIFRDPETNEYISRASGFRAGNSIIINGLRKSYNEKYSDEELISVLFKFAKMMVERTKDDEYPIQNVFVGEKEAFSGKNYDSVIFDVNNIQEGLPKFYLDTFSSGIVLATTADPSEKQKFVPIVLGPDKVSRYEVKRGKIREYTNSEEVAEEFGLICTSNFEKAKEKILMIDSAKKLMEQKDIPLDQSIGILDTAKEDAMIKIVKNAISKLDIEPPNYELLYAVVGDDFYVAIDKDYNIHSNYLDIPSKKAKMDCDAMINRANIIKSKIIEMKKDQEIREKLENKNLRELTSDELNTIIEDKDLLYTLKSFYQYPENYDISKELPEISDRINTLLAEKITILSDNLTAEEKKAKIKKVKDRIELISAKDKREFFVYYDYKSYIDFFNLDDENFKKIINILDNIKPFDLNDFNGAVVSIDQLSFPKKENNRHIVRLFNEIVEFHKKSLNSSNKEENRVIYNNLLLFLELGIDKSILDVVNNDKNLIFELKNRGYINNELEEIDAPTLIEIIKMDIENTRNSTRYDFLHKIVDLYVEKERANYINNSYFEEKYIDNGIDSPYYIRIFEALKNNNIKKAIEDLCDACYRVNSDDEDIYRCLHNDNNEEENDDLTILRKLNALYRKNYQVYRTKKDPKCKREARFKLPFKYNSGLRSILQNYILTNLQDYSLMVDGKKVALRDCLISEIVKNDSNNILGENKSETANHLLDLYIERVVGLNDTEKKDYAECIKQILEFIKNNKKGELFVDGKPYDDSVLENSKEISLIIKNAEKRKRNNLENAEKKIKNILVNDTINSFQRYLVRSEDGDLELAEYLVKIVRYKLKDNITNHLTNEKLQNLVLKNLQNYEKDNVRLDLVDKEIIKIIREEVANLHNSKATLYIKRTIDGITVKEEYNREDHKKALELDKEILRIIEDSDRDLEKDIEAAKLIDIFKNMSKYEVRDGESKKSLYDFLVDKVGNSKESFREELDKIIRIKSDFDNKEVIKAINNIFKSLLPIEDIDSFKSELYSNGRPYDLKANIRQIDELTLEKTREYYLNGLTRFTFIDVISQMNIEELKKYLLEDEEAYNSFMNLLRSKKILSIPKTLDSELGNNGFDNTSKSMAMFISHFKEIIEGERKESLNKGTIFSDSSLSVPRIIDLGNTFAALSSKYAALFGKEDALYLYKDPPPNASKVADKEKRFALGVYYLLSNYNRQYVTVPAFDERIPIEDGYDKSINVVCGNFSNPKNLTYGERTEACMRLFGEGRTLFDFCLSNENGFHIDFVDPDTNEFISRASGFRIGNSIIINGLRRSYNEKYSDEELIKVLFKVARIYIDKTKNSPNPIENVFVGEDEAFKDKNYPIVEYDVDNIQEGYPIFYLDAYSEAIILDTTANPIEDDIFVPIDVMTPVLSKFEVQRGKIREYTNNEEVARECNLLITTDFEKAKEKILMIDSAKKLMEQGDIPLNIEGGLQSDEECEKIVDIVKKAMTKLEIKPVDYEIKYAAVADDYYIVIDGDYNIRSNYLVTPGLAAKKEHDVMYEEAVRMKEKIIESEQKQVKNERKK